MSIINEKIRYTGQNSEIKFTLGTDNGFVGYQQEIDNITQITALDLVNPVLDAETRKFKLDSTIPLLMIQFNFYFKTISLYNCSFIAAGFSLDEVNEKNNKLLNSFFILDFYDSNEILNQTRIFRTYLTKIIKQQSPYIPEYSIGINNNNQFYNWYIPQSYIDAQTGSTCIGYTKFSFYNAKSGTTTLFYNEDNETLTTPEKMFFKTELDLVNKTWKFISPYSIVKPKEIIRNTLYIDRVNSTFDSFDNKQQTYPIGTIFDYITGTYLTT